MRQAWILVTAVVATTDSRAQQSLVAHLLAGQSTINETSRTNAPVAGHFDVVGVSLGRVEPERDASNIYLRVPTDWKSSIVCVEITSRSGLYEAADVFDVPAAPQGGYVKLDFRTRYPTWYTSATSDSFAVSAREGTCRLFGSHFLPVVWSSNSHNTSAKLLLAVQTGRTAASALIVQGASHTKIACRHLESNDATAFDAICSMPISPSPGGPMTVQIEKCAFDECIKGETIRLGF